MSIIVTLAEQEIKLIPRKISLAPSMGITNRLLMLKNYRYGQLLITVLENSNQ